MKPLADPHVRQLYLRNSIRGVFVHGTFGDGLSLAFWGVSAAPLSDLGVHETRRDGCMELVRLLTHRNIRPEPRHAALRHQLSSASLVALATVTFLPFASIYRPSSKMRECCGNLDRDQTPRCFGFFAGCGPLPVSRYYLCGLRMKYASSFQRLAYVTQARRGRTSRKRRKVKKTGRRTDRRFVTFICPALWPRL